MRVKGSVLRTRFQYVREQGPDAWERFVEALSPEARKLAEGAVLVTSWYPFKEFTEITETIDRLFGAGDLELCRTLGRYACDINFTGIYKVFFRVLNIQFLINRAAQAWHLQYEGSDLVVTEKGRTFARVELRNAPTPKHSHCLAVIGWIERAGELTGCQERRWCVLQCRARSDAACEWTFEWK